MSGEGEGGEGGGGAEGTLCGGEVGVVAYGGDEMGLYRRVRKAKEAVLGSRRWLPGVVVEAGTFMRAVVVAV